MAQSREWTEYHLTENGWVMGSELIDPQQLREVAPPDNRILTRRFVDELRFFTKPMDYYYKDVWSISDIDLVNEYLLKFPYPDNRYRNYKNEN